LAEVAAPGGGGALLEVVQRLEPELSHPVGLVLVLGDRLDELAGQPLGRLVDVVALGVVEPELLLVVGADVLQRRMLGELGIQLLGLRLGGGHVSQPPASRYRPRPWRRTSPRGRRRGASWGGRFAGRTASRGAGTPRCTRRARTRPRRAAHRLAR